MKMSSCYFCGGSGANHQYLGNIDEDMFTKKEAVNYIKMRGISVAPTAIVKLALHKHFQGKGICSYCSNKAEWKMENTIASTKIKFNKVNDKYFEFPELYYSAKLNESFASINDEILEFSKRRKFFVIKAFRRRREDSMEARELMYQYKKTKFKEVVFSDIYNPFASRGIYDLNTTASRQLYSESPYMVDYEKDKKQRYSAVRACEELNEKRRDEALSKNIIKTLGVMVNIAYADIVEASKKSLKYRRADNVRKAKLLAKQECA